MSRKKRSLSEVPLIECEYFNPTMPQRGLTRVLQLLDIRCDEMPVIPEGDIPEHLYCKRCGQMWHTGFGLPTWRCDFCNGRTNWLKEPPTVEMVNTSQKLLFGGEEAVIQQKSLF